jgi:hypothetical protein
VPELELNWTLDSLLPPEELAVPVPPASAFSTPQSTPNTPGSKATSSAGSVKKAFETFRPAAPPQAKSAAASKDDRHVKGGSKAQDKRRLKRGRDGDDDMDI